MIGVDVETYDPELTKMGPGVYRNDGHILGVGLAFEDGTQKYFSLGHDETPETERAKNRATVQELLGTDEPKVGASFIYDLDWLINHDHFTVGGTWHDVQLAEPLLDEYLATYSLDSLAQRYLGERKQNDEISEYAGSRDWKGDARQYLWKMPADLVGKYCMNDARQTAAIYKIQKGLLAGQNLNPVYELESGLLPLLLQMRRTGIRVDEARRVQITTELEAEKSRLEGVLYGRFGQFNFNASAQLASVIKTLGLDIPKTEKGNESVTNEYLETLSAQGVEYMHQIVQLRKLDKIIGTFMNGAFRDYQVGGRIHAQFVQLASDEGGTVTGRFSCRNPNLTQIPARNGDEEEGDFPLGNLCRSIFIPEEGCWMGKADLSQGEYRMLAHYACGPGSDELRQSYIDDPHMDYHARTSKLSGLPRKTAKNLGFGVNYGMGIKKMMQKYGWDEEKAYQFRDAYYSGLPFLIPTRQRVETVARARGYIRTIYGRRERVSEAIREKKRYYIFLNRLLQGSVADLNKKGMFDAYRAGLFDVLSPHLTVHDELVFSVPKTVEGVDAYRELKHIMETCISGIKVPIIATTEYGPSYGETVKTEDFSEMYEGINHGNV